MRSIQTIALSLFVSLIVCSPLIFYRHAYPLHARAQTQVHNNPDCQFFFSAPGPSLVVDSPAGNGFDNRRQGCNVWAFSYTINGSFAHESMTIQSAVDTGSGAGTWGTGFPVQQAVITGTNPTITAIAGFLEIIGQNAFVRVEARTAAGAGTMQGTAFGWRIPNAQ